MPERTDTELLKTAIEHFDSQRRAPRWWHVASLLGLGSTSSYAICRRMGLDPNEEIGGEVCISEGCECECHFD